MSIVVPLLNLCIVAVVAFVAGAYCAATNAKKQVADLHRELTEKGKDWISTARKASQQLESVTSERDRLQALAETTSHEVLRMRQVLQCDIASVDRVRQIVDDIQAVHERTLALSSEDLADTPTTEKRA